MGRHEMRWEEMSWDEVQVWSVECGVWRVQCEVWGKCLLHVALHRGRARVMFLDNNTATASHKARTHGPGWRTAHASSLVVVLGSDSWKLRWHMRRDEMRWEEMSWDKVRRAQMRWSVECEECSVKCGAWRVQCEVWCGVWSAVRSEKCGSVECEVWSLECEECSVKCAV